MVATILGVIAVVACDRTPAGSGGGGAPAGQQAPAHPKDASGTLTVEPAADAGFASTHIDVDGCWSGQMLSFHGVDLFQEPDTARRVRAVDDPVTGWHVVLLGVVPGKARIVVEPASCSSFDVRVEPTNNWLNEVQRLRGAVHLACEVAGIGRVSSSIDFADCSFDNRAGK